MELEDTFDFSAPDEQVLQRNNVTQKLNEVYAHELSEIDPALFQMQVALLTDEMWE